MLWPYCEHGAILLGTLEALTVPSEGVRVLEPSNTVQTCHNGLHTGRMRKCSSRALHMMSKHGTPVQKHRHASFGDF